MHAVCAQEIWRHCAQICTAGVHCTLLHSMMRAGQGADAGLGTRVSARRADGCVAPGGATGRGA
eukprot:2267599-Alexandrium_andersonii.AAC.1